MSSRTLRKKWRCWKPAIKIKMAAGRFKYIVVGAGLFGSSIAERIANGLKERVLVVEKRDHIGGNCYSYEFEDTSITVHKYGTHIFHTDDKRIWDYVNKYTEFNRYQHRVLTTCRNKVYSVPINLGTINAFYNLNLKPKDVPAFLACKKKACKRPDNIEGKIISLVGNELYEAFIKGYTTKQWGSDPRELPAEIITRLPSVRTSYYDSYYDEYGFF
jgi:UDP-galactopyranose mutase